MITREQVAGLQPGDVVRVTGWDGLTVEGSVDRSNVDGGSLWLGSHVRLTFSIDPSAPSWMERPDATLTVVSRAPRPLYVNHPRTKPAPGDVVRDADGDGIDVWMFADPDDPGYEWRVGDPTSGRVPASWSGRDTLPARLRLLVDGETGQVVPS